MTQARIYLVGGAVRDKVMGIKPKDLDYAVEAPSYAAMKAYILERGGKIHQEREEFLTIRAGLPKLGHVDFVLCRKDGVYSDGRHPDNVQVGTLMDDLARRDFTMNAMAQDEDGEIIDPFNGREDIAEKLVTCVGVTEERFSEDALRMLRALRFAITKGFNIDPAITRCLRDKYFIHLLSSVSVERMYDELLKCFKHNTILTIRVLNAFDGLMTMMFEKTGMWIKPTLEQR